MRDADEPGALNHDAAVRALQAVKDIFEVR